MWVLSGMWLLRYGRDQCPAEARSLVLLPGVGPTVLEAGADGAVECPGAREVRNGLLVFTLVEQYVIMSIPMVTHVSWHHAARRL